MKFTKVAAGWYATEDGSFAVVRDGTPYVPVAEYNGSGVLAGCADDGWAVIAGEGLREDHQNGQTVDWFPTKREAVAYAQWMEARA